MIPHRRQYKQNTVNTRVVVQNRTLVSLVYVFLLGYWLMSVKVIDCRLVELTLELTFCLSLDKWHL